MWKKASVVALGLAALTGSTAAWAGDTMTHEVFIDTAHQVISGNFGAVRNSTDTLQYLDIGIQAASSTGEWGFIFARDKNGQYFMCNFTDPTMVSAVKALTADSYIQASYNSSGVCTLLEVRTSSRHETKKP